MIHKLHDAYKGAFERQQKVAQTVFSTQEKPATEADLWLFKASPVKRLLYERWRNRNAKG